MVVSQNVGLPSDMGTPFVPTRSAQGYQLQRQLAQEPAKPLDYSTLDDMFLGEGVCISGGGQTSRRMITWASWS